jgi:protein-L-isoaspartate(D-aspartate) O-methyltransferase
MTNSFDEVQNRTASDEWLTRLRAKMVEQQLVQRSISDEAVLQAMRIVPRHLFVPGRYQHRAYDDGPLPILAGQTISQPYVVALMIAQLQLSAQDRVLEIGTGSGYAAAVLSRIVTQVYTIERHRKLVEYARSRFQLAGYHNIQVRHGDGTQGWPEYAPYDGIVVAAGGPAVPLSLQQQLAPGGRLVIPVGQKKRQQWLIRVTRIGSDHFDHERLNPVAFVPLIGEEGWEEE